MPQTHPNPTAQISLEKRVLVKGRLTAITGTGLGSGRSGSCPAPTGKFRETLTSRFSLLMSLSHQWLKAAQKAERAGSFHFCFTQDCPHPLFSIKPLQVMSFYSLCKNCDKC